MNYNKLSIIGKRVATLINEESLFVDVSNSENWVFLNKNVVVGQYDLDGIINLITSHDNPLHLLAMAAGIKIYQSPVSGKIYTQNLGVFDNIFELIMKLID